MSKAGRALCGGMLMAAIASTSIACGYCIEDRIASVYDHSVVIRAILQKHQVVFFAIDGQLPAGEASRRTLEAIVESVIGVDKGSARVSVEAASLSVAFNPRRAPLASLERALGRKFASRGLSIAILRVTDQPGELKSAGKL
jgi:hypothetical protein